MEFFVAFCVNKPHTDKDLEGVEYIFLSNSDDKNLWDGNDSKISQKDVCKLLKKQNYDLLLINNSYTSPTTWYALLTARLRGIPVITRMTAGLSNKKSLPVMIAKRIIVSLYCSQVKAALYECKDQMDYCLEYGMKKEQLFFAPCTVDNDYFYSQKIKYDKEELRQEIGIDEDTTALIYTGRLIPLKRLFDIVYAVEKLVNDGQKVKLFLVGDGELMVSLKEYVSNHNLEDTVYLCGKMDHENMSRYLSASDVFVLASERDKSPKALSEAMNFELPIVISDRVNNAIEMCSDGENGYIYKMGDVDQLYEKLSLLISDKDKMRKMGLKSREIVSGYSFDVVINAWEKAAEYAVRSK